MPVEPLAGRQWRWRNCRPWCPASPDIPPAAQIQRTVVKIRICGLEPFRERNARLFLDPTLDGGLPDASCLCRFVVIFEVDASQFKQELGIMRVVAQSFAEDLLGIRNFIQFAPQPIGHDEISINILRIQFGGKFQPRQNLPNLGTVAQIIRRSRLRPDGVCRFGMKNDGQKRRANHGAVP